MTGVCRLYYCFPDWVGAVIRVLLGAGKGGNGGNGGYIYQKSDTTQAGIKSKGGPVHPLLTLPAHTAWLAGIAAWDIECVR